VEKKQVVRKGQDIICLRMHAAKPRSPEIIFSGTTGVSETDKQLANHTPVFQRYRNTAADMGQCDPSQMRVD